jgi:hypothetical protein
MTRRTGYIAKVWVQGTRSVTKPVELEEREKDLAVNNI